VAEPGAVGCRPLGSAAGGPNGPDRGPGESVAEGSTWVLVEVGVLPCVVGWGVVVVVVVVVVEVLEEVVCTAVGVSVVVVVSVVPRQWSSSTPPWFPCAWHSLP
jgi:hypothetical protein